jgi:hypothetical protein
MIYWSDVSLARSPRLDDSRNITSVSVITLSKPDYGTTTGNPANILPNSVTHEAMIRASATLCHETER